MLKLAKQIIPRLWKRRAKLFVRNFSDSITYSLFYKLKALPTKLDTVIFICKGNICRSAFAEHYMKEKSSVGSVRIDSFGLDVDQGKFSPAGAIQAAYEFDVDLTVNFSRRLTLGDLEKADLIIPMEYGQYKRLVLMAPHKKKSIKLLRDFAPFPLSFFCNIDDPFGWDEQEFIKAFTLIQKSIDNLCNKIFS